MEIVAHKDHRYVCSFPVGRQINYHRHLCRELMELMVNLDEGAPKGDKDLKENKD